MQGICTAPDGCLVYSYPQDVYGFRLAHLPFRTPVDFTPGLGGWLQIRASLDGRIVGGWVKDGTVSEPTDSVPLPPRAPEPPHTLPLPTPAPKPVDAAHPKGIRTRTPSPGGVLTPVQVPNPDFTPAAPAPPAPRPPIVSSRPNPPAPAAVPESVKHAREIVLRVSEVPDQAAVLFDPTMLRALAGEVAGLGYVDLANQLRQIADAISRGQVPIVRPLPDTAPGPLPSPAPPPTTTAPPPSTGGSGPSPGSGPLTTTAPPPATGVDAPADAPADAPKAPSLAVQLATLAAVTAPFWGALLYVHWRRA